MYRRRLFQYCIILTVRILLFSIYVSPIWAPLRGCAFLHEWKCGYPVWISQRMQTLDQIRAHEELAFPESWVGMTVVRRDVTYIVVPELWFGRSWWEYEDHALYSIVQSTIHRTCLYLTGQCLFVSWRQFWVVLRSGRRGCGKFIGRRFSSSRIPCFSLTPQIVLCSRQCQRPHNIEKVRILAWEAALLS